MSLTFDLLDRFKALAQRSGMPLEPMEWFEVDFWDGGSRTVLGLDVRGTCSGERLWIRTLDHGGVSSYLGDEDGCWWPPTGPESCLRPARGQDGPQMMLVAPTEAHLQAIREDIEATLAWIQSHRALQTRLTTLASLESAAAKLEDMGAHFAPSGFPEDPQGVLRAEAKLLTFLEARVLKAFGEGDGKTKDLSPMNHQARLAREWAWIQAEGLLPVFYVLYDLSVHAQRNGVRLGAAGGALPGLLTAHLLALTSLDPVVHGLPCEPWFNAWAGDPRIVIHAEVDHAAAFQQWVKPRARRHGFQVEVKPSRPLSMISKAFRASGLPRPPHEAWEPFDPKVFECLQQGEVEGFGLDPEGLESNLVPIHPTEFRHLVAWAVLGHCWGLGRKRLLAYVDRRCGRGTDETGNRTTPPALEESYGLLLYQEQVSALIVQFSGCSEAEGDQLRKEWVSGNPIRAQKARQRVLELAVARGSSPDVLEALMDQIEQEGPRTFCKCHATSQAGLAYELAWWMTNKSKLIGHKNIDFFEKTNWNFAMEVEMHHIMYDFRPPGPMDTYFINKIEVKKDVFEACKALLGDIGKFISGNSTHVHEGIVSSAMHYTETYQIPEIETQQFFFKTYLDYLNKIE